MFKTNFRNVLPGPKADENFTIWFAFITFLCWYNVISYNFSSSPLKWAALSIGALPSHVQALFPIGLILGAIFALTLLNEHLPKIHFLLIQAGWVLFSFLILLINHQQVFIFIVTGYAFVAGIIFARIVYQLIFFIPKRCWLHTIVYTYSIVQLLIYLYRIFPIHNYPSTLYWFGIILQLGCLYFSIGFNGNVLAIRQSIPDVKLNIKLMLLLFGIFILLNSCMAIIKNIVLPSFATSRWLNYYQIIPDAFTWVALYLWGSKLKRVLIFQICLFLISLTFISFQLLKGSIAGHFIARTLIEPAYLCWDVFGFSLIVDLTFKYGKKYTWARTIFLAMLVTVGLSDAGTSTLLSRSFGIQSQVYVFFYLFCFILFFMFPYIEHVLEEESLNGWNTTDFTTPDSNGLPAINGSSTTGPNETIHATDALSPPPHELITAFLEEGITLTPREKEVLEQIMEKQGNDAIANLLGISKNTVKVHVKNILCKFKVKNRQELYSLCNPHDQNKVLTKRETEVLQLLLAAKSTEKIAQELYISINTVRIHVWNICRKHAVADKNALIQKLRPPD
jgi:DNA-binding CsgD family transcriptional regulator